MGPKLPDNVQILDNVQLPSELSLLKRLKNLNTKQKAIYGASNIGLTAGILPSLAITIASLPVAFMVYLYDRHQTKKNPRGDHGFGEGLVFLIAVKPPAEIFFAYSKLHDWMKTTSYANWYETYKANTTESQRKLAEVCHNRYNTSNTRYNHINKDFDAYSTALKALKSGVNPNSIIDFSGNSCLHNAINSYNLHLVKLLLEHGANPNNLDQDGHPDFLQSCHRPFGKDYVDTYKIIDLLLEYGANPDMLIKGGHTPYTRMKSLVSSEMTCLEWGRKMDYADWSEYVESVREKLQNTKTPIVTYTDSSNDFNM